MRRSDREIKEFDDIVAVMDKCDVVRLAFNDEERPYIVPLNFGMTVDGGTVTLYFHSALEGKKMEFIRAGKQAAFEMDCAHELSFDSDRGRCTMGYESVIGSGRVELVPERDKLAALDILVRKYHPDGFAFSHAAVPVTAVYKLTVEEMTGKRRKIT